MKLNKLIILSFLLLIYSYFIFFLPDDIFIILSLIICGFFLFIIPILDIIIIIKSFTYVFKNNDFLGLIPILLIILSGLLFCFLNPIDVKDNIQFYTKMNERNEVVQFIKNKELNRDDNNHILLPDKYKDLAVGGYVYVPELDENELLIGFLFKTGLPDEDLWLVYSTGGEELIEDTID